MTEADSLADDSDNPLKSGSPESSSKKRPPPRGTASYPRKRGITACQVCRARRTKCDNGVPSCSFCLKTGATCIRSPVDLSAFDPASIQILEKIEELNQQFRVWSAEHSHLRGIPDQQAVTPHSQSAEGKESRSWLFPPAAEELLSSDPSKPHLLAILKASNEVSPGALSASSPLSASADLSPHSVNMLTDNFFKYVHVKNPILDERIARSLVSRLALHGVDWSAHSCLALLICSLGAIAAPFESSSTVVADSPAFINAHSYFIGAQRRLGSCFAEGGLIQAQCLFLAGVYQMTVFKPLQAWRMFLQSLACCQDFAFLTESNTSEYGIRDTAWSENMVLEQAVYWSAWKSEQELRWDIRPPDFCSQAQQEVEFPKFFPEPPAPTESDTDQHVTAWTFYLTEISLRRLTLMLAADVLDDVTKRPLNQINRLMQMLPSRVAQMETWLKSIPQPMSLDTPSEVDDVCKFVLRGHLLNVSEMLYWPFLNTYIDEDGATLQRHTKNLLNNIDSEQRSQLKLLAEKALEYHAERVEINYPGFLHRHHGTWFMIRSCSRSATMLLKAVIFNKRATSYGDELRLPENWYGTVTRVLDLHRHWRAEVPDAAFRLHMLESLITEVED